MAPPCAEIPQGTLIIYVLKNNSDFRSSLLHCIKTWVNRHPSWFSAHVWGPVGKVIAQDA